MNQLQSVVFCPTPLGIFEQSLALQERAMLNTMAIGFYSDIARHPYKWLPNGCLKNYLKKRYHPSLDNKKIRTLPFVETVARVQQRFTRRHRDEIVFWFNAAFDRWVSRHLPKWGNLVFGYESSSLFTFERAKVLGIPCVLYQPIGCSEFALQILGQEAERYPELAPTLRYNYFPEAELTRRRKERELADAIICASSFTKKTLVDVGVSSHKIHVEPYGVDQSVFCPSDDKFERFSVIWASSFTQTKGIKYLLEALRQNPVENLEFVVAGYPYRGDPTEIYQKQICIRHLGHIPRHELGKVMRRCHAHVFPTLLDGFGRNIIEAMASGLPVITTPNCAGPDLIEDGVTGFIVPIRDIKAIYDRLQWIYQHPTEARQMGLEAQHRVKHLTQADYRYRFANKIQSIWEKTREDRRIL